MEPPCKRIRRVLAAILAAGIIAMSAGCTPAAASETPVVLLPTPTRTPAPASSSTPDRAATEDAARFAATVQAYQTETASQKSTERAGGDSGAGFEILTPVNIHDLERLDSLETGPLFAAAFSPNGRFAVLLSEENTLVYDLNSAQTAVQPPLDGLDKISFTASGTGFMTNQGDGTLSFRSAMSAEPAAISTNGSIITRAVLSPDGSLAIAGTDTGAVLLIDISRREILRTVSAGDFQAEQSAAVPLGFSPDGVLAAVYFTNLSSLWVGRTDSLLSGTPQGSLISWLDHAGPIAEVRISPDWQNIVWISRGTLQVMGVNGDAIGPLRQEADWVQDLVFLPGMQAIVYTTAELTANSTAGIIRGVDLQTGDDLYELSGFDRITAFALAPGGERAAGGLVDGQVLLFDPASGDLIEQTPSSGSPVTSLAFNPSGSLLAVLRAENNPEILAAGNRPVLLEVDAPVYAMSFDPSGSLFVLVLQTGEILSYGAAP